MVTKKPDARGHADVFAGVLYAEDATAIVLRAAHAVAAGERSENVPLDGEIILLLADVDYIQRP